MGMSNNRGTQASPMQQQMSRYRPVGEAPQPYNGPLTGGRPQPQQRQAQPQQSFVQGGAGLPPSMMPQQGPQGITAQQWNAPQAQYAMAAQNYQQPQAAFAQPMPQPLPVQQPAIQQAAPSLPAVMQQRGMAVQGIPERMVNPGIGLGGDLESGTTAYPKPGAWGYGLIDPMRRF